MRADRATRHIVVEPERVVRAFTDPDLLLQWLVPEDMTGRLERFDAASGYRMVLNYDHAPVRGGKADADSDVSEVRRVELDIPHRLVEAVDFPSDDPAYSGTMLMTWTFEPEATGTLVTIEATEVPPGVPQDVHVGALVAALARLARVVE